MTRLFGRVNNRYVTQCYEYCPLVQAAFPYDIGYDIEYIRFHSLLDIALNMHASDKFTRLTHVKHHSTSRHWSLNVEIVVYYHVITLTWKLKVR